MRQGRYHFVCLVGEWRDPNLIDLRRTVELAKGSSRVDFNLPCGSISGKLIDKAAGKPLAGAAVAVFAHVTPEQRYGRASLYSPEAEPTWELKNWCKTDKNGAFHVSDLTAGKMLICAAVQERSRGIPVAVVTLADGEDRSGIVVKMPRTGSAEIQIAGMKDLPKGTRVLCVDEYGFTHRPDNEDDAHLMMYEDLSVGKMKAVVQSSDYLPTQVPFEVKPGQATRVSIKLSMGPRIAFRPKSDLAEAAEQVSVAFRITTLDGKPVLQGDKGPIWGKIVEYVEGADSPSITVKPGTYLVKAAVRADRNSWRDESDLTWSGKVSVVAGRDAVVEIPWEEQ